MARISSLVTLGVSVALSIAAAAARADGVAYPTAPSSPARAGQVYGGWTTPQPSNAAPAGQVYGRWTTPQPPSYGTWTTPRPADYGTWTTQPNSGRAYGSPAPAAVPASAAVVGSAPSPGSRAAVAAIEPACGCTPWRFGAWGRYWRPSIGGETLITLGGRPGSGSAVDVHDDLSLDAGDGFEAGVSVAYGRHRATLAYESDSFSGSATLDRAIVFHGATFPAGSRVESDLDLTFWKLGYDYAFVERPAERAGVTVRGGLSAWLWDYDGRVRSALPSVDTSRSFSHVLPVATLSAEGVFGRIRAGARVDGGLVASDRYVIDAEASVGVKVSGAVSLDAGYRWMNLSFHETTNEADLTLYGPFAGISIEF